VSGRGLLPGRSAQLVTVLRAHPCTNALRREHQTDDKIGDARRGAVVSAKTFAIANA
jgi:hypothetical protein